MKLLEEIYVSVYDSVYSKQPRTMSFLEVVSQCIQPVHAPLVSAIRGYHEEGDREAVQQMKLKLNCFTPAGTFDGAHSIKNFLLPSNIIGLDYDHVPNRLEVKNVAKRTLTPSPLSKVPRMASKYSPTSKVSKDATVKHSKW